MTRAAGFTSQIVPGGLYGGANASAIRQYLFDHCNLKMLWGLINTTRSWFPKADIDRFAAYAARPGGRTTMMRVQFGLARVQDLLANPVVTLDADEIRAREPATYAIADLRNPAEQSARRTIYGAWAAFGVTVDDAYQHSFSQELNVSNYSRYFTSDPQGLAVYEGRMIDQFDHRAKTYNSGHGNSAKWDEREFGHPLKAIVPQWRILRRDIPSKLRDRFDHYRVGFGDVANPRNERSFSCALIPPGVVCGHKVPTILFRQGCEWAYMPFLGVANSFVVDWVARGRLSSPTMSFTLVDSLPLARLALGDSVTERLAPLVLRLVCSSVDMTPYWNSMSEYGWTTRVPEGSVPVSVLVDPSGRAEARAEIDAIVAKRVYGLSRDELAFILDTFGVLRRREERMHGDYRTKQLVLSWYDKG
jgi:hypothetical protein